MGNLCLPRYELGVRRKRAKLTLHSEGQYFLIGSTVPHKNNNTKNSGVLLKPRTVIVFLYDNTELVICFVVSAVCRLNPGCAEKVQQCCPATCVI